MDVKTAEMLLELLPAQILAAGLVRACAGFTQTDAELAQRLLANCWLDIAPSLHETIIKKPTGRIAASTLVIESYLMNSGDWKKMERKLTQNAPISAQLTESVVKIISESLLMATSKRK